MMARTLPPYYELGGFRKGQAERCPNGHFRVPRKVARTLPAEAQPHSAANNGIPAQGKTSPAGSCASCDLFRRVAATLLFSLVSACIAAELRVVFISGASRSDAAERLPEHPW